MKGSYFGFGILACKVKNTLIFLCIYVLSYFLNDSQMIRSTMHFPKPLRFKTLPDVFIHLELC